MGVAFSHGDAMWSYGGYADFCDSLCRLLGYEGLNDFQHCLFHFDDDSYAIQGLVNLSNYSKDYNALTTSQLEELIPVLKRLSRKLDKKGYDYLMAQELIKGMQKALKADEPFRMT